MSNFPSVLNTFARPVTTDKLNSPSHSALHNTVSSALGQVEAMIGVVGDASVVGTLSYDVRSPASNGGGHIQTANKGGTGQITYAKGDTLVAKSASVLSKLSIGLDNDVLIADSATDTGVKWGTSPGGKLKNIASIISMVDIAPETSIYSVVVPGSTLGTTNAIRATSYVNFTQFTSSVLARVFYGGGIISSVLLKSDAGNGVTSMFGQIHFALIANNSATAQRGILEVNLSTKQLLETGTKGASVMALWDSNTSSINSSANQTLGMTMKGGGGEVTGEVYGTIVEKIT
jgi:hypothetical protein